MKIAVADLRPNPFRNPKRFPLKPGKIEALRASIHDTQFWDNLLARPVNGGYELAYGHHRIEALRQEKIKEIDIPVRDLSDTKMAQIMAHENREEWGATAENDLEVVRAIIAGYAEGRIELPRPAKFVSRGRIAPSFQLAEGQLSRADPVYTIDMLSKFLGWKEWKTQAVLDVLAATENATMGVTATVSLSTKQAQAIATQTRRVEQETGDKELARNIADQLAVGMRPDGDRTLHDTRGKNRTPGGSITIHNIRQKTDDMIPAHKRKAKPPAKVRPKKLPPVDVYVEQIASKLDAVFPSPAWKVKLKAVIDNGQYVHRRPAMSLVKALRRLAERATKYADQLEAAMEMEDAA